MIIFTNKRAVRNYIKSLDSKNQKIEHLITIDEFNQKAIYIDGFKKPNKIEREIIFNSVVKELKGEKVFDIDTNIFNFLSYSKYFFSFFKELAEENISIKDIANSDYYEDYQKHILILELIYEKYQEKMKSLRYIDNIFTPNNYQLNLPFIKSIKNIEYQFQGRISTFQVEILEKIAKEVSLKIIFTRSRFNRNIDKQLNLKLKPNREYCIDFKTKKILSEKLVGVSENVEIYALKNRFAQIGFVKERIYYFHKKMKIPLEDIGVILLDENFATNLKTFDSENNLNFSMGQSFKDSNFYKFLNSIYLYIENRSSKENLYRKEREVEDNENLKDIYNFFKENWYKKDCLEFKINIIKTLKEFKVNKVLSLQIINIFELFQAKTLETLNLRTIFHLFKKEIESLTIDDVQGGKVTVQGLLETRGSNYKAVIILDFNDEIFPKKEEKDFFINSDIRKSVELPLIEDREALQKLFLESVLQKSSYSSISFIDSETTKISRFFHDFDFRVVKYNPNYEKNLINIVIPKGDDFSHWNSENIEISQEYKFRLKPLSNSRLRIFQECPRRFYLSAILKIKEHSFDESIELLIGNILHRILEKIYSNRNFFQTETELHFLIKSELEIEKSIPDIYIASWIERVKLFVKSEIIRFNSGIKVFAVEKNITIENYRGFKLTGKIDRVDILPNGNLILIDYKLTNPSKFNNFFSGKDEEDFQLIFYYILMKESGEKVVLDNLYYYNLTNGTLIKNKKSIEDFNEVLDNLAEMEVENIYFEKNTKCNRYCKYEIICNTNI